MFAEILAATIFKFAARLPSEVDRAISNVILAASSNQIRMASGNESVPDCTSTHNQLVAGCGLWHGLPFSACSHVYLHQ